MTLTSIPDDSILLYSIGPGDQPSEIRVELLGSIKSLETRYSSLCPIQVGGKTNLLAYDKNDGQLDAFELTRSSPWLRELSSSTINTGFDQIEPFVLGNQHHLLCYNSKDGIFEFLSLTDEFSFSKPFRYFRDRGTDRTHGFTTVEPFDALGKLGILAYNFDDGHVVIYDLKVRTTSPPGVPPLWMSPVWSHYWAQGWTRFAFFKFGGENFFLKTNVVRPNVNIDHILDDLSGTVPVGSHLTLEDADRLDIVRPLSLVDGAPHFITYEKTGRMTVNRIRSDCLGWTTVACFKSKESAGHVVPFNTGGTSLILVS